MESTRCRGHYQSFFFNVRFSSRKSQNQQNLGKKLTHFTNLNSLDIQNNMLPQHSQKAVSLYKFFGKLFFFWSQKKHSHCTLSWLPRTAFLNYFENNCLYSSVYLRNKILGFVKGFTNFHFDLDFSIIPSKALKQWNFPDNLDLKGKIVAKFLIGSNFLSI